MARDLVETRADEAELSEAGLDRIDAALQDLIDKGELAGASTLVARHGFVARRSFLGMKDIAKAEPLTRDTIFRIYSMTKPVTGVAMMTLWDQGLWTPDDPIAKHLPAFADVKVFAGLNADGTPKLETPDHAPTMRELMTHSAGLSYGFTEEPWDKLIQAQHIWTAPSLAEFARRLAQAPLAYQPGSKWLYSLSMDVQGAIIEALSGQKLADFMQSRIFGPLGMVDTSFYVPADKVSRLATLYRTSASRGLLALERPPMLGDNLSPPVAPSGGGGLVSTLDDYARLAQMLLNEGELGGVRVLSPEAVTLMSSDHLPPALSSGIYGVGAQQMRPGFSHGFDCAVFTDPAKAGIPVGKGTFQWDGAAGTWFWVDPANDLIFVGMIQRMQTLPNMANCQQLAQHLMAEALV